MTSVSIEIVNFVDDHFPGFVECRLVDAQGQVHMFSEKVPVVSTEHLRKDSKYPCPGAIRCEIGSEYIDHAGRFLARINTERPDGVESTSGETQFVVLSSQVAR